MRCFLPAEFLAPMGRTCVSADGAYATKECHRLQQRKEAKPIIPPRSPAGYWEDGEPRNEAVKALNNGALKQWKHDHDYHPRSPSESGMYRDQQLNSPKRALRDDNAQVGEAPAEVKAMHKVIGLGMPISTAVN